MNIVTILNYNWDKNSKAMLCMWLDGVLKNSDVNTNIFVLTEKELNKSIKNHIKSRTNKVNFIEMSSSGITKNHNLDFKLKAICELDFPFIFLDMDMFVNKKLSYLWKFIDEKPFIGVDHQFNIVGHTGENSFLNSGVLLINNKDKFLKYGTIINCCEDINYKFEVSGKDQAAFYTYFKRIGYEYTHKEIGKQWNSCAGYSLISEDDLCNWNIEYSNNNEKYEVCINHYWHEFKPWLVNCPIFNFYLEYMPNI